MVSAEEKRKLMRRLGDDCPNPIGAVLKCLAGVMALLFIAAGPWTFLSSDHHTASHNSLAAGTAKAKDLSKQGPDADDRDSKIQDNRNLGEKDNSETDQAHDRSLGERMQGRSIISAE